MHLDRFDRQLLNLLQEDAALTAERLAEHVALSASAIQRRVRRLREAGVIVRDIAIVDPAQVGRPTFYIVSIRLESERPEPLARLKAWVAGQAHIQQAFYVTGDADLILIVTAPDTATYESLMARMLAEHLCVERFTTQVALGVVKRGLGIPVPDLPGG